MKKIYFVICCNYRKLRNSKISHIFEIDALVISIICSNCDNKDEKYLKKKKLRF